jgi:hypothetical protein|tara:strand:- start:576 stop:677 length:102 start_codon:yes stop_codon:yes gene_type:complete
MDIIFLLLGLEALAIIIVSTFFVKKIIKTLRKK